MTGTTASYPFNGRATAQCMRGGAMIDLHGDHLGSVTLNTGGVAQQQTFDAWKKVRTGGISVRTRNDIGQLLNESYRYDKLGNLTAKGSLGIGYGSILTGTDPHGPAVSADKPTPTMPTAAW
ncbi:MAG: hypothetical protein WHS83_09620 [Chloroflexus sp.]|uniref:hypothetical protein n=1 Tax=Chloroflexus sp. TaxID=1904827 RepID=UPI0030A32FFF